MKVIAFRRIKDEYGWLGNMAPIAVTHGGRTWRTAEHLFQALRFDDSSIHDIILEQVHPVLVKDFVREHKEEIVIQPGSTSDLDNMRLVLALKFEQNPDFGKRLLDTGDALIVEDCTRRVYEERSLFWGAALSEEGAWKGENQMGKLLMEVRDVLRSHVTGSD